MYPHFYASANDTSASLMSTGCNGNLETWNPGASTEYGIAEVGMAGKERVWHIVLSL
jgi:hypothetical protein